MSEESSELVATGRDERSLRSCTTGFALINPDTIFLFFFFFFFVSQCTPNFFS
jgi:hypothetical protein